MLLLSGCGGSARGVAHTYSLIDRLEQPNDVATGPGTRMLVGPFHEGPSTPFIAVIVPSPPPSLPIVEIDAPTTPTGAMEEGRSFDLNKNPTFDMNGWW